MLNDCQSKLPTRGDQKGAKNRPKNYFWWELDSVQRINTSPTYIRMGENGLDHQ